MGRFGIGQPFRRVEDERFLTGTGRYTDDIRLPGMAAAAMVRSPHAHARIGTIDTAAAAAAPGVLGVFTAADLGELGAIPTSFCPPSRGGAAAAVPPRREALARERVVHVGEAVALVVAETQAQARDAAELVMVDYDALPAVGDTPAALRPGAPELWPGEAPGNVWFDWEMGDAAATAAAFQGAARVVELTLVNNRLAPMALEPRSAIGQWQDGTFTLHTGSQGSHSLRDWLCRDVFRIPPEQLRVVAPDVGGGFGMRLFLFPEHVLVLWAARRLGRPVKWAGDRSEAFLADTHGRDHHSHARLALDTDGRFLALAVTTEANLGAYVSQFGGFVPTLAGSAMLPGVYAIPALHVRVRGVLTNTAPVDAYRGAGRPEAAFLIERLTDVAARELDLAPDAIRRRNFIPPAAMPWTTAGGHTYDSGEFERVMDEAMRRADWAGFPARRADSARRGRRRGLGLSYYVECCGGGSDEAATVRIEPDGAVTVLIGTQSTGQGHETAYAQMVAERLGLTLAQVRVIQGDTALVPEGKGTGGSRSLPVGGMALAEAADDIAGKVAVVAAQLLQARPDEIELAGGQARVKGSERYVAWAAVARAAADAGQPLAANARFQPKGMTFPNGCHLCEVEIDPATGVVELLRYTIVDDVGVVLNPLLLAGQIQGGAVQGISQALFEEARYDPDSGQLLTGTLMDYAVARADGVPAIDTSTIEIPCRHHPLGVKGAGEAGTIGAPPAVINAVVDALADLGIRHVDMPATPLKLWQAIRAAEKRTA